MHAKTLSKTRALSHLDIIHNSAQKQAVTTGEIRPTKRKPKNIISLIISLQEEFPAVPTFTFHRLDTREIGNLW